MRRKILRILLCLVAAISFNYIMVYFLAPSIEIRPSTTALVLIDIWEERPYWEANGSNPQIEAWIEWWENEVIPNVDNKILPLLKEARERNIVIVFSSPYIALSPKMEQLTYGEPIINRTADLDLFLRTKGIKNIVYAGYALNNCVLSRPTGVRAMRSLGYNIMVLEDCTLSVPKVAGTHQMAVKEVNKLGSFITSQELFEIFDGKQQ